MSLCVKNVVAITFTCPIIKVFQFAVLCMYIKMAVLSKIKSHSDVVNYFKELPLHDKPIKKP